MKCDLPVVNPDYAWREGMNKPQERWADSNRWSPALRRKEVRVDVPVQGPAEAGTPTDQAYVIRGARGARPSSVCGLS